MRLYLYPHPSFSMESTVQMEGEGGRERERGGIHIDLPIWPSSIIVCRLCILLMRSVLHVVAWYGLLLPALLIVMEYQ